MSWSRLARDVFLGLAIAFVALRLFGVEPWNQSVDAYAYWTTRSGVDYGGSSVGVLGSYLYTPAFALLLTPLTWLPWNVFNALWTAVNIGIVWYLFRRWSIVALAFLPISLELVAGNVHLMYALVAAVGLRYPAAWLVPLVTKVTPGIGIAWFALRREWRPLGIAIGATLGVVALSVLLAPTTWSAWISLILGSDEAAVETPGFFVPIPLPLRLVAAVLLLAWGAMTSRRWVLPVAMTLALPLLWLNGLAVLAGLGPTLVERVDARRIQHRTGSMEIRTPLRA